MIKTARELQDDKYTLVQTDWDLVELLDNVSMPDDDRQDITGAIVSIIDGEYEEVWLCEDSAYYDLSSVYRSLSYYRPPEWDTKNLPHYWLD